MAKASLMTRAKSACTRSQEGGLGILLECFQGIQTDGNVDPLCYIIKNHREKSLIIHITRLTIADGVTVKTADSKAKHGASISRPSQVKGTEILQKAQVEKLANLVAKKVKRTDKIEVDGKKKNHILTVFPKPEAAPVTRSEKLNKAQIYLANLIKNESRVNVATIKAILDSKDFQALIKK